MRIARREADTDVATILGIAGPADEGLIDALLRLLAQIVVNAGDNDDELVAGVGGACYQAGVVGRLARLHMTDDKAATVPGCALAYRILPEIGRESGRERGGKFG